MNRYATPQDEQDAKASDLERALDTLLNISGRDLPKPVHNLRGWHPIRKWEIDRAFVDYNVGIELQGAVWTRGKHTRGKGYIADCDKLNQAQLKGWILLWFTATHIEKHPHEVTSQIRAALRLKGWEG